MSSQSQGYVVRIADVPGWLASGDPVANWFTDALLDGLASDRCLCGHKFAADYPPPTFFFYVGIPKDGNLLWGICGRCSAMNDDTLAQKHYNSCLKPVLPNLKPKGVSFRPEDDKVH